MDVSFGERTLTFLEKAIDRGMIEMDFTLLYRDFEKICEDQPKPDNTADN